MSSDAIAIRVRDASKHYLMFARPEDRLKQMVVPRLRRLAGLAPSRYYHDFAALSGVSFDIRRGETVGILGRNGSGKSTLLQIVCGTLRPTNGTVEVNGRIAALLELGSGFNPEFTGRENVYLNATILGLSRGQIDERFESIARFADIGDFIEQPVKTYSSGMYVRLAFATAINVDPDILVVDEALAVGDDAFQRKCYARIEEIQSKGGTILFVSHAAQTVMQLCSRALLLDAGELILDGRPKTVVSHYQRLVNASPEMKAAMRLELLRFGTKPEISVASDRGPSKPNGGLPADDESSAVRRANTASLDGYDSNLVAQSTVAMEERGARIRGARIVTAKGQQVNVLRMGRRYVFEYSVEFSAHAENVGFGMQLRTIEGTVIAGAHTGNARTMRLQRVEAGVTARVAFEFACLLLPGTYFASCGARGIFDSEERQLHRIIDATVFRVAPEAELIATGRFDIGILATIGLEQ